MTDSTDPTDIDPADWTGIYYDADSGSFVTIAFPSDGTIEVHLVETDDDNPTVYDSATAFRENEPDLYRVPERAVENPVAVAEDVYAKGFEVLLEQYAMNDIAILYADQHTKIVEDNE